MSPDTSWSTNQKPSTTSAGSSTTPKNRMMKMIVSTLRAREQDQVAAQHRRDRARGADRHGRRARVDHGLAEHRDQAAGRGRRR